LGWRAALAIPVGLFLQAALFGHGAFSTLGVNAVVMGLPALAAGGLFRLLHRRRWVRRPEFGSALVVLSTLLWTFSLVFSVALLVNGGLTSREGLDLEAAVQVTFHPLTVAGVALLAALAVYLERRLEPTPEFALGLLLGQFAVLLTLVLQSA